MVYLETSRSKVSVFPAVAVAVVVTFGALLSRAPCLAISEMQYEFPVAGEVKFLVHITSQGGLCTGSIVNQSWVLTAAHCFYARKKLIRSKATLTAGIINYDYSDVRTRQVTKSLEIHVHPKFRWEVPSKYDVALVKLKEPLVFSKHIGKIEVSGEGWPDEENITSCVSYGFGGYMSTAPPTADLKRWNVTAGHGENACPCALKFQWKRLVCVKEPYGATRVCKCDDGGPMVCNNKVRAIAHMVWNREECDDVVYPTVKCSKSPPKALSIYMFLCPVNSWLHSIVPEIPETPASCRGSPPGLPWTPLIVLCTMGLVSLDQYIL